MDTDMYFFGLEGPLDAVPAHGQMRAANFQGFTELVRQMGGAPRRILERHGLDPRAIANPDSHVPCQAVVSTLEYCATALDEPLFGLRLALLQEPDVFGCVTALCRAAPDVRSALESLIAYIPVVHSPEAAFELVESGETVMLAWNVDTDFGVNEQAQYQALILNLKLLRTIGGPAFRPDHVELAADPRPSDVPEIERLIGCPVRLRTERSGIAFPARIMDEPIPSANRLLYRLLGGYLARLKLINREGIVARAQSYVRGALPAGTCSVERCAEKLGLSVRTLQARLAGHASSFSDLVEQEREKLAMIYLKQTRMPLDELAERLGYGEQTSFGRAFKRWTGTTPQKFRAVG